MSVPYQTLIDVPPQGNPPNTPPQPQMGGQPPAPIRLTFWAELIRSRPQKNSLSTATCIFVLAGMNIAYSVGFGSITTQTDNWNHMHTCWFFGAIIGSLIGLALVERFTKRLIYFLSIGLAVVEGICFVSTPEKDSAIIFGRYCDGIAFGIILPAFIAAASEESFKRLRGMTLSIEHVGLATGMLLEILFSQDHSDMEAKKAHGIFVLIYAGLSVFLNLICTVESPVYLLRRGNETEAINVLHSLQRRDLGPNEVPDMLAEHKKLLEEDEARGFRMNFMVGLKVYPKFAVLGILAAISFSVPLTVSLLAISVFDLAKDNPGFLYFYIGMRCLGVILGAYMLDTVGRRSLTAFSLFAGGILLIVFGTMFSDDANLLNVDKMRQAQVVITVFQIFAGIVAVASTSYLGEAFSISVKQYFVVASVCLECLIQVLLFYTFKIDSIEAFAYSVGIVQTLFAGLFIVTTPETKETTLREAVSELGRVGMIHLF